MTKLEKILVGLALALAAILVAFSFTGCGGAGDEVDKLDEVPVQDGFGLVKTYSGSFTSPDKNLSVPEMRGKPGATFVLAYWAYSDSSDLWTQCSDGWLDDTDYSMSCWVSWTYGTVTFTGFPAGSIYMYRVDVYGDR